MAPLGATNPERRLQGPRGQEHKPWGELTLTVGGCGGGIGGSFLVLFSPRVSSVAEVGGQRWSSVPSLLAGRVGTNRPSSGAFRRTRVRGAGGRAEEAPGACLGPSADARIPEALKRRLAPSRLPFPSGALESFLFHFVPLPFLQFSLTF